MPLESLEEESILESITLKIFNKKKKITYAISGNILNGLGVAVEGATVAISGIGYSDSTTTDSSGDFSFSGLVEGTYTVTPTKTGLTFVPTNQSITVPTTGSIDFVSPVTYSITLTGVGYNGNPSIYGWSYPTRIQENDSNYAYAEIYTGVSSEWIYLKANASQIPTNCTIKGVTTTVIRSSVVADDLYTTYACLLDGTTQVGNNKADTGVNWPIGSWATITYGGVSDLWGYALTPAFINSGNFGFGIRGSQRAGALHRQGNIQYVTISVTVTVPAEA